MTKTKLILIEGIPGSGKSTTAEMVEQVLNILQIPAELYLEGNLDHPADYDRVSYFTQNAFSNLLEQYNQWSESINLASAPHNDGFLMKQNLIEQAKLPHSLIEEIRKRDIYELPLEEHIDLLLERWETFSKKARLEDKIYIFECCFIQNPITIGTIKYGAKNDSVMNYIQRLAQIIEPLHPILFYVEQKDLRKSFTKAMAERPKEWSEGFIDYYNNQGLGKKMRAEGIEGTLAILEERRKLEYQVIQELKMDTYRLDNSAFDKQYHYKILQDILSKAE